MAERNDARSSQESKAEKVKDKGQELAAEAKHKAQDVAHKAEDVAHRAEQKAAELADQAGEKARELGDRAGHMAVSKADEQKDRVVEGIHTVADALRRGSERLPENERQYAPYVNRLADNIDRVSGYLERRDVRGLSHEVESFARQHTTAFLGGAFALGLMGARFLKSSGQEARRANLPAEYRGRGGHLPSHMEEGAYVPPGAAAPAEREGGYA